MAKRGQPTKYKPEYCEAVLEMGKEGYSKAEMALELGHPYSTIDNWTKAHPEFLEAIKMAVEISQGWWERKGRQMAVGEIEGGNPTTYIFNMKNRFREDWRDKHEVDHNNPDGNFGKPTVIELVTPKTDD